MTRSRLFNGLLCLWALLWLGSWIIPALQPATGDSFTRGLNRVVTFFGFQIAAGVVALAMIPLRPSSGWHRHIAWVPSGLAAALLLLMAYVILNAERSSPLDGITDNRPVTVPAAPAMPVKPTVGD